MRDSMPYGRRGNNWLKCGKKRIVKDYILQLPSFEGPLDLLLHFVRTRELDIRNFPVAPICSDYLEFIKACEEIDVTLSSEWLAMASRLIYIKSCTLLPGRMLAEAPGTESYWDDVEDPRSELIRELLDRERLMAVRNAIPFVRSREMEGRATFRRDVEETEDDEVITYELGELGIFDLLDLDRQVLLRREVKAPMEIRVKHRTLGEVIREILSRWLPKGTVRFFRALLPEKIERHHVVITFLALLELAKSGRVILCQVDPTDELSIERLQ